MVSIISWNVNGLRAMINRGGLRQVLKYNPCFVCLQETKISPGPNLLQQFEEYPYQYCHYPEKKKGYSGTAIMSKEKPKKVIIDFEGFEEIEESEGRVISLEFDTFYLVNVYAPNSQRKLLRLDYRLEFDKKLNRFLKKLSSKKPVIVCGDFNVAHTELDIANPKGNLRNPGYTEEERGSFTDLLEEGFVDTFRALHPDEAGQYTWWTYRNNARERNIGWRLDYFLVSEILMDRVKSASILKDTIGSDHAPVVLELTK